LKKILFVFSIVAVFTALLLYRGYQHNIQQKQVVEVEIPKVEVVTPCYCTFSEKVSFTAEILPSSMSAVVCKVPGRTILEVNVEEGDTVKKGDVLAKADDSLVRQDIAKVRAILSKARVHHDTIKSDHERMKNLLQDEVISQQTFDHTDAEYRTSLSQIREAQASLEQLRIMLGYHSITSPVSGVVSKRNIDPGDTSSSQIPAFIINQQEQVKIRGAVPESSFFRIGKGQPACITLDVLPGKTFEGRVDRMSPTLDPVTRTGEVEVRLPSNGVLKPGTFARVSIETGSRSALALPRDVVRPLPGTGEFQLFLVSGDIAVKKIVRAGAEQGNMLEIPEGVSSDDLVITTITEKLRDGLKVEVMGD
jgi:membrane fusion protein (multidrug efflux system)